jgi:hypothetical protein
MQSLAGVLNLMQGKNLRDEQKKAEVRRESRVTPGRRIEATLGVPNLAHYEVCIASAVNRIIFFCVDVICVFAYV